MQDNSEKTSKGWPIGKMFVLSTIVGVVVLSMDGFALWGHWPTHPFWQVLGVVIVLVWVVLLFAVVIRYTPPFLRWLTGGR